METSRILEGLMAWLAQLETATGMSSRLVGAALVVVIGWAAATIARIAVRRVVRRLQRWLSRDEPEVIGEVAQRQRAEIWVSRSVFWLVWLFFVMIASEVLGLRLIAAWLGDLARYVPRVLAAVAIGVAGMVLARVARRTVAKAAATAGMGYAQRLGRLVQMALVLATLLVAVEQLGVEVGLLTTALMIALAAIMGSASLAFGLGGNAVVANILAGHYVRKIYEAGHLIRIDGVQGRIARMTPTAVIVQAEEGEVVIPARQFIESRSMLLTRGA